MVFHSGAWISECPVPHTADRYGWSCEKQKNARTKKKKKKKTFLKEKRGTSRWVSCNGSVKKWVRFAPSKKRHLGFSSAIVVFRYHFLILWPTKSIENCWIIESHHRQYSTVDWIEIGYFPMKIFTTLTCEVESLQKAMLAILILPMGVLVYFRVHWKMSWKKYRLICNFSLDDLNIGNLVCHSKIFHTSIPQVRILSLWLDESVDWSML